MIAELRGSMTLYERWQSILNNDWFFVFLLKASAVVVMMKIGEILWLLVENYVRWRRTNRP